MRERERIAPARDRENRAFLARLPVPSAEHYELATRVETAAREHGVDIGNVRTRAEIEPGLAELDLLDRPRVHHRLVADGPQPRRPTYRLHAGAAGRKR